MKKESLDLSLWINRSFIGCGDRLVGNVLFRLTGPSVGSAQAWHREGQLNADTGLGSIVPSVSTRKTNAPSRNRKVLFFARYLDRRLSKATFIDGSDYSRPIVPRDEPSILRTSAFQLLQRAIEMIPPIGRETRGSRSHSGIVAISVFHVCVRSL
jgi:hypothetical protein